MNEHIYKIAEKAGFVRFTPEENFKSPIDWSCNYSKELEEFSNLLILECAEIAACNAHVSGFQLADLIKDYFKVSTNEKTYL